MTTSPTSSEVPSPSDSGTPTLTGTGDRPGDTLSAILGGGAGGGPDGGSGHGRPHEPDVVLGVPLPALRETARRVGDAALHIAEEPQYPLGMLALVGMFLLVQDVIDRRDPKLAAARVTSRDGSLSFPDLFPPGRYP